MGGVPYVPFAHRIPKMDWDEKTSEAPEVLLSRAFKQDLNVEINPQALRMFIRSRWDRVQKLAHKIHDGDSR